MCQKFDEYDPRSAAAVYKLSQTSAQPVREQSEVVAVCRSVSRGCSKRAEYGTGRKYVVEKERVKYKKMSSMSAHRER